MRNQRSFHRAAALLRQGMALSVAVALVCSLALSSAALEVDVLNETTGLVESVDLDEDAAQPEEDAPAASDADEEPEETPTEETGEAPADADEETPKTDAEETPTEDNEEKSEDTSKADDTDDAAPDDDFLFVDDSTDEADDASSVDYYAADTVANNSVSTAYYYDSDVADNAIGSFYSDDSHSNDKLLAPAGTTMENFITNYCASGATIYMDSAYTVSNTEEWSGNVTIDGGINLTSSNTNTAIHVKATGTLTLGRSVTIQNFSGTDVGAVYVDNGTLNIEGATLKNNTAVNQAGCLWIKGGILNLYDGTVSNNTTTGTGSITLSDTNKILGPLGNGGGIYVSEQGTFNMYGGAVSNNTRKNNSSYSDHNGGGGVYIENSTFNLYDGTISDNISHFFGAGVNITGSTSEFNMYGGTIRDNHIGDNGNNGYGAGVRVEQNTVFNMYGGVITQNKSQHSSALSVLESGTFNMYGGTIVDNQNSATGESSEPNEISVAGTMNISGGTVGGVNIKNTAHVITDGSGNNVAKIAISIGTAAGVLVTRSDVTIKDAKNQEVTSADYGFDDTYTDKNGCIYLWLPAGYTVTSKYQQAQINYKAVLQRDNYGTYENVGTEVTVQTKLLARLEIDPPSATATQDYSIQMYSAEDDELDVLAEPAVTYQWQSSSSSENGTFTNIPCTNSHYTPGDTMANQYVRVIITKDSTTYTSEAVYVVPRQLSFQVPASLTVMVSPEGDCTISAEGTREFDGITTYTTLGEATGTIQNNSAYPIVLTSVTFTWNDAANTYFTNFNTTQPTITLNGASGQLNTTNNTISWTPANAAIPAKVGDRVPGELDLQWSFFLNGNAISQKLQADTKASIGTITYTVSFADTASGGDSTTTTRAPGTPVVF